MTTMMTMMAVKEKGSSIGASASLNVLGIFLSRIVYQVLLKMPCLAGFGHVPDQMRVEQLRDRSHGGRAFPRDYGVNLELKTIDTAHHDPCTGSDWGG